MTSVTLAQYKVQNVLNPLQRSRSSVAHQCTGTRVLEYRGSVPVNNGFDR